ncbi:MAG TPA: shikimate dehydrogenase [Nitrososphaerales archaeon]|uniref:shikimate dehydrogenase n=1 Tax=Croceibacter atlanticus TaxID=313588 RepID=UPI0018146FD1|nr:shikimate dehydrogenase [Croceibacter atlanticus]HIC84025.1 shikimate dehydrogenase [Nitrososphaerales archaeon]
MENISDQPLYCLLGEKIQNSLSPSIHNAFFKYHDIDGLYITLNVDALNLKDTLKLLHRLNFHGANVTIPYKESIMQYLDSFDPLAKEVNAVNTILNKNNKLIGYNTDVDGFMIPINKQIQNLNTKTVVILGAGGAAKAVLHGLANANCKDIIILNRNLERAQNIISALDSNISVSCNVLNQQNIDSLSNIDIIVNTIPLNSTNTAFTFGPQLGIQLAYDLEYIPKETNFIKQMKILNADIIYGYEMLLSQAKLSFQIWTGLLPDNASIDNMILSILGE